MPTTLYGLRNCDTCKKALKAFESAGKPVEFVDIRSEADLPTLLPRWLAEIAAETLINTRSTTWRGLDPDSRAAISTDPLSGLADHPTLIKRPVIADETHVTVGWTASTQAMWLKA